MFSFFIDPIISSRLAVLTVSSLLVCIIYLLGVKMSSKTYGFLSSFYAIFEPYFICYSTVPHNDVFAMAMGITSFYILTLKSKYNTYLSIITFYFAFLTRPELYPIFIVPLIIFSIITYSKNDSKKEKNKFIIYICAIILPIIYVYNISSIRNRFSISENFLLFFNKENIKLTINIIFKDYDSLFSGDVIMILTFTGLILGLLMTFLQSYKIYIKSKIIINEDKNNKVRNNISESTVITACLFLIFFNYVIVLTVYGHGYTIVNGVLNVTEWLPDRYVILPRLLLSYPITYPLYIITRILCSKVITKNDIKN